MSSDDTLINVSLGFWKITLSHQLRINLIVRNEGEEVVDVADFAEMGTDGVDETQLQEDVALDEILPRLVAVAVDQVDVFHAGEVVEAVLDDVPVGHSFVGLLDLLDLLLHLVFEDIVEEGHAFDVADSSSVSLFVLLGLF